MVTHARRIVVLSAVALSAIVAGTPASSEPQGRWVATSTASIAITGDISLDGDMLTFGNGAKLALRKVAEHNGRWSPAGGNLPGVIYKLLSSSDPLLLNGNTLCGMKEPVTYVVLSEPYEGALSMSVFTSKDVPRRFGDGSCAAYFYER